MAWLQRRGTKYRICFRYAGELHRQALGTSDEKEAEACRARLEDTLNRLERGWLKLPPDVDLPLFLLSGGEAARRPSAPSSSPAPITLVALRNGYLGAQETALERGSLKMLRIHLDHLVRTLGEPFPIRQLTLADLQRHVARRRSEKGRRGRPVTGYTIRKEITSLAGGVEVGDALRARLGHVPERRVEIPQVGREAAVPDPG